MKDRRTIFNILLYAQFCAIVLVFILVLIDPLGVYSSQFSNDFKIFANSHGNVYDPDYGNIANIALIISIVLYLVSIFGLLRRKKYSIYLFLVTSIFGILYTVFGFETVSYQDKYVSTVDTIISTIDGAIIVMATLFSNEVGFFSENER